MRTSSRFSFHIRPWAPHAGTITETRAQLSAQNRLLARANLLSNLRATRTVRQIVRNNLRKIVRAQDDAAMPSIKDVFDWELLRLALRLAHAAKVTDQTIITESGVGLSVSRLSHFRNRTGRLNDVASAGKILETLDRRGFVIKARHQLDHNANPMLADGFAEFYQTDIERIELLHKLKVCAFYWGYKYSFRKPDHIIRSIWRLSPGDVKYLAVDELQRSSGKYEPNHQPLEERSTGIALVKSDRLWLTLRELSHNQPRIVGLKYTQGLLDEAHDGGEVIVAMAGHILESDRKYTDGRLFTSSVLLLRASEQHNAVMDYKSGLDFIPPNDPDAAASLGIPQATYTAILKHLEGERSFF